MNNSNATTTVTALDFGDQHACQVADLSIACVSAAASMVLFGAFQFVPKDSKSDSPFLIVWVFATMACDHLYIEYARSYINNFDISNISLIARWIPVVIGFILLLASVNRRSIFAAVVTGLTVAYVTTHLDPTYTAVSVGVSVLFAVIVIQIPVVKLLAISIVMYVVCAVTFAILIAGLLTPDDQACGHKRNLIALCYPDCPTITTDFTFFWPVALVVILGLSLSLVLAFCYKADKRASERQQRMKISGDGGGGGGEEGKGLEHLHRSRPFVELSRANPANPFVD